MCKRGAKQMVGVCAQGTREGGRPGLPLRPQKMLLPKQLDKHRGQRKGGGLRQKTLHSLKTSFQKKGWRWVRGNPNGLPGTPGRREGRVESPRSPVTPPRWWLRPWRSSPQTLEKAGKAYSEAARPRREGRQPPRGSRGPGTAGPGPSRPPARCLALGASPRSLPRALPGRRSRLLRAPAAAAAAARSPTGFQFRDEPPPPARNSGTPKPLSPPAVRLPGRAGSSAPPAGGQPFPTSDCGTCRSAPGRKWPNLGAREPGRRGTVATFRTASEGPPRPRAPPPGSPESGGSGGGGGAGDCGKRAAKARATAASPRSGKEGRGGLRWALRPASYGCPSPLRRTYLRSAERMPPTALERVPTPRSSAASSRPGEIQVQKSTQTGRKGPPQRTDRPQQQSGVLKHFECNNKEKAWQLGCLTKQTTTKTPGALQKQ